MSTSSPVPSDTSQSSPRPSGGGGGGGVQSDRPPPSASASNLYLVTFLATLFLLLFISCAIILRSYILRRRYQRQVEVALGAGMLLTPRSPGSRHARLGHMPKLFDSWIINGDERWQDMRPLAAQPVFVKKKRRDSIVLQSPRVGQPTPSTLEPSTTHPNHGVRSLLSRLRRTPQDTTPPPNSTEDIEHLPNTQYPPPTPSPKSRVEMLQISVLITMPSQNRTLRKNALADSNVHEDDDEIPLPELVLGITRIPYRHKTVDAKSTPQPLSSPPSSSDIPLSTS